MADPLLCVSLSECGVCAFFPAQAKEGQRAGQPLRSEKAYGHSVCVCVTCQHACVCLSSHVCHKRKVSEIFRQTLLILQGSLRSTGGRIRIHLAVLSGGGGIPSIIRVQG